LRGEDGSDRLGPSCSMETSNASSFWRAERRICFSSRRAMKLAPSATVAFSQPSGSSTAILPHPSGLCDPEDCPSLRCPSDKRSWPCGVAQRILTPRTERLKPSVDTQTKWLQELVAEIFTGAGRLNQPIHIPLRKADEHLWSPVLLRQKYLHFIEDYRI